MAMELQIHLTDEFLLATARGRFVLEEAQKTFLIILDAIVKHRSLRVLFNGLEIDGEPEVLERFYYGAFVAEAVLALGRIDPALKPQFAYALKPPVLDTERRGEREAACRGMDVKAFSNLQDARNWLLRNQPEAAQA